MKIKAKQKTNQKNGGFVALISAVLVSAVLLAIVLQNTVMVASLYDEANHKQHRFFAVQSAAYCLDRAILELTHDYFYQISSSTAVSYASGYCSIVSVGETVGGVVGDGHITITVSGISYGITATIVEHVLLSNQNISQLFEQTYF